MDSSFRKGFSFLAPLGLTFDAWCFFPQLGEIADLAKKFPQTTIVVDHCGGPLGIGSYGRATIGSFTAWKAALTTLQSLPNVYMKISGLGMSTVGLRPSSANSATPWQELAQSQQPFIETCISVFGPERCMFGSNFPVDRRAGSYETVWNTYKHVCTGASQREKNLLFCDVAAKIYRIDVLRQSPA